MKDLDEFLPHIMQYAPGCSIPAAHFGIRQAAIEFCERTKLWRWEDEFSILSNDCEQVTTPYGSVLHEIDKVLFNDDELERATPSWLDAVEPGWRTNSLTGIPRYVTQTELNTIRLVPGQDGHVNIYVWLKPSQDATQLPDFLSDQYREIIAGGALARLLAQKNQPYSDPTMGAGFAAQFDYKITDLLGRAAKGQQRAARRSRSSMF